MGSFPPASAEAAVRSKLLPPLANGPGMHERPRGTLDDSLLGRGSYADRSSLSFQWRGAWRNLCVERTDGNTPIRFTRSWSIPRVSFSIGEWGSAMRPESIFQFTAPKARSMWSAGRSPWKALGFNPGDENPSGRARVTSPIGSNASARGPNRMRTSSLAINTSSPPSCRRPPSKRDAPTEVGSRQRGTGRGGLAGAHLRSFEGQEPV